MGVPQKLEQDQYSLSVSLISHAHLQIKLDSMRLQELLPILRKGGPRKWWVRDWFELKCEAIGRSLFSQQGVQYVVQRLSGSLCLL